MSNISDALAIIDASDVEDLSADESNDDLFEPHDTELEDSSEDEDPNSAFLPGNESIIVEEVYLLEFDFEDDIPLAKWA
ncbi:hypothetical protein QYM36_005097 [Artemia franciscana]|uniref:Uncharacterized protein n=1 Tax=Artemia franciscana TaxID=6661 RepID=A0AA88I0T1_ARTSF|nr:hypothetical protein QYM36_005097 [Artemia franciscana]